MKYLFTILAFIVLKQCNSTSKNNNNSKDSISGKWKIVAINDVPTSELDTYFIIDITKNEISSSVGCNDHTCQIEMIGNKLKIKECFSTEMYCDDLDEYEIKMRAALLATDSYNFKDSKLLLIDNNKKVQLTLSKEKSEEPKTPHSYNMIFN